MTVTPTKEASPVREEPSPQTDTNMGATAANGASSGEAAPAVPADAWSPQAPTERPPEEKADTATPMHSPAGSIFSKKSADVTPRQNNRKAAAATSYSVGPSSVNPSRKAATTRADSTVSDQDTATIGSQTVITLPAPRPPSKCPLFCVFYAEFDIKVGPVVKYQSPRNFMDQEIDMSLDQVHEILAETFEDLHVTDNSSNCTFSPSRMPPLVSEHNPKINTNASTEDDADDNDLGDLSNADEGHSIFDSCSEYIITGNELSGNIVNLSTHHFHVVTRPTIIQDERFERNSYFFCLGFVLRRTEDPRPFRSILSKWAVTVRDMEIESHFLSKESTRPQIQTFLEETLVSLNSPQWECNLALDSANVLNLKLFHPPKPPAFPVPDHAVPVLLRRESQVQSYDWDLSINWVLMHIDGITNARQISLKAEIDMEMVRACLRVLRHHGLIALADMFFFSNRYEPTDKATSMLAGKENKLLYEAVDFVIKRNNANSSGTQCSTSPQLFSSSPEQSRSLDQAVTTFSSSYREHREAQALRKGSVSSNFSHEIALVRREDYTETKAAIAELYCACNRGQSIGELWMHLVSDQTLSGTRASIKWKKIFKLIDHRRFTLFGLVHGLLRRVHNFPLLVSSDEERSLPGARKPVQGKRFERSRSGNRGERCNLHDLRQLTRRVASMMDGRHCDDALVCAFERPLEEIFELVEGKRIVSVYATSPLS